MISFGQPDDAGNVPVLAGGVFISRIYYNGWSGYSFANLDADDLRAVADEMERLSKDAELG